MIELKCGDCIELMRDLPDKSIDFILCDLPYGTTSRNKWDSVIPFDALWGGYKRIIKDNGCIALFGQPPFSSNLIMSNIKMFRYEWIWEKTLAQGFLNANRMPMRATENISIFYKHLPTYNPQKTDGAPYDKGLRKADSTTNYGKHGEVHGVNETGARFPINILRFSNANHHNQLHPTQKPVDLCEYLIKTYTNEGDIVLDNCMGSGTTGVACVNTRRSFIGFELDEHYFEIARDRIESAVENAEKGVG